jgi:hypothetical protein
MAIAEGFAGRRPNRSVQVKGSEQLPPQNTTNRLPRKAVGNRPPSKIAAATMHTVGASAPPDIHVWPGRDHGARHLVTSFAYATNTFRRRLGACSPVACPAIASLSLIRREVTL